MGSSSETLGLPTKYIQIQPNVQARPMQPSKQQISVVMCSQSKLQGLLCEFPTFLRCSQREPQKLIILLIRHQLMLTASCQQINICHQRLSETKSQAGHMVTSRTAQGSPDSISHHVSICPVSISPVSME